MAQSADDWQRIETLLGGDDYTALSLVVTDLSDEQRATLVPILRAFVRPNPDDQFRRLNDAGLGIVGAGILPDAASLVSWLGNRHLAYHTLEPDPWSARDRHVSRNVVPHVHFVLRERKVAWLADLAQRLAERLPKDPAYRTDLFELISRLLSDTGQLPPMTDGYVAGWVRLHDSRNFATELAADPRLAALVPRFFEVEAVGVTFDHDPSWGVALAQAGGQGRIDRTTLLNSCVQRLRRGGKPGTTRAYQKVYENLTPSSDEIVEHLDDYLAMLQAPLSTVAGMAQQELFRLDDVGRLPSSAFAAASRDVLLRSEKKLVRAQLARMKVVAQRDQSLADGLARAVAGAFSNAPADMGRAMVQFIVGLAPMFRDAVRGEIAEAGQSLPTDLRADLVRALGPATTPQPTEPSAPPRPVWPGPRRVIAIRDLDEAAREIEAVLRRGVGAVEAAVLEPVLEALVRFGTSRREDLRTALASLLHDDLYAWMRSVPDYHDKYTLDRAVAALVAAAVGEPISAADDPDSRAEDRFGSALRLAVIDRVYAMADAMRSEPGPHVVSLPTWSTGVISAADLLARLTVVADNGWEPWSFDLEHALLRLDRDADLVASFAALGTSAGRRVADWHGRGLPGAVEVEATTASRHRHDWDRQIVDEPDALVANVRAHRDAGAIWGG